MKKIFLPALAAVVIASGCCDNGASISTSDSISIARAVMEKSPDAMATSTSDTVPGIKSNLLGLEYKSPSQVIDDRTARKEHLAYLLSGGIRNSRDQTLHSVWIPKDELKKVYDHAQRGARLSFCINNDENQTYLGIIMVPLDQNGRNILKNSAGESLIVNKVEPCPDNCPEGSYNTTANDSSDLNHDRYGDFLRKGLWYKQGKWVDKNNVER